MHELTICEALLESIDAERETRGFSRVKRVRVEVGRFSCLDPEALAYAFDILTRGTFAEHAALDILRPPGRATCLDCGATVEVDTRLEDCPACNGGRLKPVGGTEMRFIEMEVV